MSRPPRVLSKTGLYHVIFRGINRQNIFEETQDYKKLLEIIKKIKTDEGFEIYAYCLMANHVHIFLKEKNIGDIKKIMHKVLTRYVVWYNHKYQRSGSLIGNRYKSEPIEDEKYYFALIRYIHQNPIKAGLVSEIGRYMWSSYNDYIKSKNDLTDIEFTLSMLSENRKDALTTFAELHEISEDMNFSISNTKKLTDEQLRRKIYKIAKVEASEIGLKSRSERNIMLAKLRENGLTIGQLERLTGISRGIISRVWKCAKTGTSPFDENEIFTHLNDHH